MEAQFWGISEGLRLCWAKNCKSVIVQLNVAAASSTIFRVIWWVVFWGGILLERFEI